MDGTAGAGRRFAVRNEPLTGLSAVGDGRRARCVRGLCSWAGRFVRDPPPPRVAARYVPATSARTTIAGAGADGPMTVLEARFRAVPPGGPCHETGFISHYLIEPWHPAGITRSIRLGSSSCGSSPTSRPMGSSPAAGASDDVVVPTPIGRSSAELWRSDVDAPVRLRGAGETMASSTAWSGAGCTATFGRSTSRSNAVSTEVPVISGLCAEAMVAAPSAAGTRRRWRTARPAPTRRAASCAGSAP